MSHCLNSCQLRKQLQNKESKVNKLKEVLDHLDDLEYVLQPTPPPGSCDEEISCEEMIQTTLSEARQLLVRLAHGSEKCNSEE